MKSSSHSLDEVVATCWRRCAEHASVSPESLGVLRWVFGITFLAILAPFNAWVDAMPRAFFDPPIASPAYLFTTFPPSPTCLILDILTLVGLCGVTVGYRTRIASIVFIVANVAASNFRLSFGKMDRDFLPIALVACMMLSDWGKHYSLDALRGDRPATDGWRAARALALLAVLVAFGMFSAGLPKAIKWIDFSTQTSGLLLWYLPSYFSLGRSHLLAPFALRMPLWLAEVADTLTPLFEMLGFLALLHSRRVWIVWLMGAVVFHLSAALLLNIPFHDQVIVYLAFVDWKRLATRWSWLQRFGTLQSLLIWIAIGLAIWHIASRSLGLGSNVAFVVNTGIAELFDLYICVPIYLAALLLLGSELRSTARV